MVAKKCRVVWTKRAEKHLREAYEHISLDSSKNALKVINDIVSGLEKAIENPEIYAADKLKLDNDGTFRAFEKHRYRLSYRYTGNIIRVLWVRHTKMNPKYY